VSVLLPQQPRGTRHQLDAQPHGISVVVCTHNGVERIARVLEALALCEVSFPAEILVVDNNSTDGTAIATEEAWGKVGNARLKLRIVQEKRQGLAFARRTGVLQARYEVIVFCDDDNYLQPDYLEVALNVMQSPVVGAAGGQCEPVVDTVMPSFLYSHGYGYALGIQAFESGPVTHSRGFLWGAGLIVRRAAVLKLYECPAFPVLAGRTGGSITSGDDSELCAGLVLLGYELIYDHRLRLKHHISPKRLTLEYMRSLYKSFDEENKTNRYYKALVELQRMPPLRALALSILRWLRASPDLTARRIPRFKTLTLLRAPSRMSDVEKAVYAVYRHLMTHRDSAQSHEATGALQ
jgi:glycosyltransferase involved in cell wall biosynthesis